MVDRTLTTQRRAELQDWYLAGLRPKLAAASSDGTVATGAAAALDRLVREFLDLERGDEEVA